MMGLFTPVWKRYDSKKALAYIQKCSDQRRLAKIARDGVFDTYRLAAVEKLTDQQLLHDLARHSHRLYSEQRKIIERLTDQTLLTSVAKCAEDQSMRVEALDRVDDPAVLAECALSDASARVRAAAVRRVEDQAVLERVARGDAEAYVREAAAKRVTDPAAHLELALKSTEAKTRLAAVAQLEDQEKLAELAEHDPDAGVRRAAVDKLSGVAVLERIALTDPDVDVRCAALARGVTDQAVLERIARSDAYGSVRSEARKRLTDEALQLSLALADKDGSARLWAARHLPPDDPRLLTMALEERYSDAAEAAIKRMEDPKLLRQAALSAWRDRRQTALKRIDAREDLLWIVKQSDDRIALDRMRELGFLDESTLEEIIADAPQQHPNAALELDKLRLLQKLEKKDLRMIRTAFMTKDVGGLERQPCAEAVEAAILLLREFGEAECYGQTGPSRLAYDVSWFLRNTYQAQPELRASIRAANAYSVRHHLDHGAPSCHNDEGPLIFDFK